jgi:hypothetical protein
MTRIQQFVDVVIIYWTAAHSVVHAIAHALGLGCL